MAGKFLKSRTPLARMMRIHDQLLQWNYPNCSSLAKSIEVASKTIQRDIDYMRYQLDLPIEYNKQKHGYFYTEPVTHFPTIPATEGEVLALFVAQKAMEQYRGTPFEQPLENAFAKLAQVLEGEISVDLHELSETMSFHHTGVATTDLEVFDTVTKALRECRELRFPYKKLKGRRTERRHVQPYHLGSIDGQWYLFAHDLARDDIRTFVLGRIQDVPIVGRKFKRDKDFSLQDRLLGAFGVFSGTGDFKVRIQFDPYAAQLIRERSWHPSQKSKELEDGSLVLSLKLDSLEEIESWILRWGSHAKVLGPSELKRRVQGVIKDMQDAYYPRQPWLAEINAAAQANQPDRVLKMVLDMNRQLDAPGQTHIRFAQAQN